MSRHGYEQALEAECAAVAARRSIPAGDATLRDDIAMRAMQGLMGRVWGDQPADALFKAWAASAYSVADAMLAAREVA